MVVAYNVNGDPAGGAACGASPLRTASEIDDPIYIDNQQ